MKGLEDTFSNLTVGHCKMCDITIQANIFVSNMASDIDVGFFFYYLILPTEYSYNGTALTSLC